MGHFINNGLCEREKNGLHHLTSTISAPSGGWQKRKLPEEFPDAEEVAGVWADTQSGKQTVCA